MPFGYQDGDDVKIEPDASKSSLFEVVSFLNGTSDLMNVNGSTTPVSFSYAPGSTETWYVSSVSFFIQDGDGSDAKFGALAALTNGILLTCQSKGVVQDITTLKTNSDICLSFPRNIVIQKSAGLLGGTAFIMGTMAFRHPQQLPLVGSSSDYIRFRIRDNLSTMTALKARVSLWKVGS